MRSQYVSFYVDTIIPIMEEMGVNIQDNFMDTSPSNGVLSYYPYVKRSGFSTQNSNFGDSHFYYLYSDCEKE
jgi:hypothetical protein